MNGPSKIQLSTPFSFHRFHEIWLTKDFKGQGHSGEGQPLTKIHTKYQPETPYIFQDIVWTRFLWSRSLQQPQRSNQGQSMTLHTYTHQPMSLQSINFLHNTHGWMGGQVAGKKFIWPVSQKP